MVLVQILFIVIVGIIAIMLIRDVATYEDALGSHIFAVILVTSLISVGVILAIRLDRANQAAAGKCGKYEYVNEEFYRKVN